MVVGGYWFTPLETIVIIWVIDYLMTRKEYKKMVM